MRELKELKYLYGRTPITFQRYSKESKESETANYDFHDDFKLKKPVWSPRLI